MEREFTRTREAEAPQINLYEFSYNKFAEARRRAEEGRVVVKGNELPWQQSRQGYQKFFLVDQAITDTAVSRWFFFQMDVRVHTGRHRHQGGLSLYVLVGKGYTVVDGVRYDWEEGDLILLPVKPNGVEHQHFNAEPGKPCKWMAMIYEPYMAATGSQMEQRENVPEVAKHA